MIKIYDVYLPFPVSVNTAYGGRKGQKRFKSKAYKAWLADAPKLILPECGCITFPVKVRYTFTMPDKRKRDLSNYIKIVEDYLVSECVLEDDNHTVVNEVSIKTDGVNRGNGKVRIEIYDTQRKEGI